MHRPTVPRASSEFREDASSHTAAQPATAIGLMARSGDRDTRLNGTANDARSALKQYPDELMLAQKVSRQVNKPGNNSPSLLEGVT
jgi:hypothetical protein